MIEHSSRKRAKVEERKDQQNGKHDEQRLQRRHRMTSNAVAPNHPTPGKEYPVVLGGSFTSGPLGIGTNIVTLGGKLVLLFVRRELVD